MSKIKIAVLCAIIIFALATPFAVRQYKIKQLRRQKEIEHANACNNNLRLLDSSKQQWALEHKKQKTDTPTMEELRPYFGQGPNAIAPACPDGGVYMIGSLGEKPTCSVPGHFLP
jgi:hypothetical protein